MYSSIQKQKILIVDDVPANIAVLTEILKNKYKLICATDGNRALKLADKASPDLILLDIIMPEPSGFEVCRQLKANEKTKDIPVIFLTAKNRKSDELKGLQAGSVDYIPKPFNSTLLKQKINIHLQLKKQRNLLEENAREINFELLNSRSRLNTEINEKKRVVDALNKQATLFQNLFENSPQAIALLTHKGEIIDINNGFERLLGYSAKDIKGTLNKKLGVPQDLVEEHESLWNAIFSGKSIHKETVRISSDGRLIPVEFIGYPVSIKDSPDTCFLIYNDISYKKQFEDQLKHNSFRDAQTGIPNRALFMERLSRALDRSVRRIAYHFAVFMVDLDRFKTVNDSFGHDTGDNVLKEMVARIQSCIRSTDTLARMGGDEFAVLLDEFSSPHEIFHIARRIQKATQLPFTIGNNDIIISSSIGIVWETSSYESAADILRDSEIAMYRAKQTGMAKFRIFKKDMHEQAVEATQIEHDLRKALIHNELFLCYQPIFSIRNNRLVGFEALVRWNHPIKGVVVPDKFIPVAEQTGIIIQLGEFVLNEAINQLKTWHTLAEKNQKIFMSINISVKQFQQPDLAEYILELISNSGVDPECIHIEITESLLAKKMKAMAQKLNYLKSSGLQIVLDDFGTGYSSFSYMQHFPIDNIKIDRSFINSLGQINDSREIVKTIINLSKKLGFDVIAEGVEKKEQLENLISMDCKRVQGFYFSKPLNVPDATAIIEEYCLSPETILA